MDTLRQDLRYAARTLRRSPGFTLVVVLTLALGIGANTAVFSVVHAVLLRPLPFHEPERLVVVESHRLAGEAAPLEVSYPDYRDWTERATSFSALAAVPSNAVPFVLEGEGGGGGGDAAERVYASMVPAGFFPLLGVEPRLGRAFLPEEDRPGAGRVAVISDGLWRRRFGGDPAVVGRVVTLNAAAVTVVGVMPPRFEYPRRVDVWVPILPAIDSLASDRRIGFLRVIGRLAPGVTADAAEAEMDALTAALAAEHLPSGLRVGARVIPLEEELVGAERRTLLLLLGAAGLVLLIACANVASLLLVRATARRGELAVRLAIGAGRGRIVRQLLTEGLVLSGLGGAAGVLLCALGVDLLVAASPAELYGAGDIGLNPSVLAFALAVSGGTALAVALLPALRGTGRGAEAGVLRGAVRGTAAGGGRRLIRALLVGEIALALVLLVGAGLLVRSLVHLQRAELGYDTGRTLTATLFLPGERYPGPEEARALYAALVPRLEALPGVAAAGGVLIRPLEGPDGYDYPFTVEGRDPAEQPSYPFLNYEAVTPGYFRAAGLELARGRGFTEADREDAPGVVVVSRNLARRFWPGEDAVGRRIKWGAPGSPAPWLTVVGVVEDARYRSLREASWNVYVPYRQSPWPLNHLVVRAAGDPAALIGALHREIRAVDPTVRAVDVATLGDLAGTMLRAPRFRSGLLGLFAALALALGVVGIYGATSYAGARRTREIGIRMALGAERPDIRRLMLREALATTALGVGLGAAGALAGARLLSGLVYGVGTADPWTFAGVALLLAASALLAAWLPARRATRVDPVEALRAE